MLKESREGAEMERKVWAGILERHCAGIASPEENLSVQDQLAGLANGRDIWAETLELVAAGGGTEGQKQAVAAWYKSHETWAATRELVEGGRGTEEQKKAVTAWDKGRATMSVTPSVRELSRGAPRGRAVTKEIRRVRH